MGPYLTFSILYLETPLGLKQTEAYCPTILHLHKENAPGITIDFLVHLIEIENVTMLP